MASELQTAQRRRDAVQARQARLAERLFAVEGERISLRDQAIARIADQGEADELLARLETLSAEAARINLEQPLLGRALQICHSRVTEAELGERERRQPKTFGGLILPGPGGWAGQ